MYFNETTGAFRFVNTGLDPERVITLDPDQPITLSPRARLVEAYQTVMRLTAEDPSLKVLFEEFLRDNNFRPSRRITAPMPHAPELLEISVWDNWMGEKPVKGQRQRFGVAIKAWTDKDINFRKADDVEWSGRASLMTPDALRKAAKKAQQTKGQTYPISPDFAAMIEDVCVSIEPEGFSAGMLVTKPYGEGTLRHDRQMFIADTNAILAGDVTASAVIMMDEQTHIVLPKWSTVDAAGKRLPERFDNKTGSHSACVMQIRYALDTERFHGWISSAT